MKKSNLAAILAVAGTFGFAGGASALQAPQEEFRPQDVQLVESSSCTEDSFTLETDIPLVPSFTDLTRLSTENGQSVDELKTAFFERASVLYDQALDTVLSQYTSAETDPAQPSQQFIEELLVGIENSLVQLEQETGITAAPAGYPGPKGPPTPGCTPG